MLTHSYYPQLLLIPFELVFQDVEVEIRYIEPASNEVGIISMEPVIFQLSWFALDQNVNCVLLEFALYLFSYLMGKPPFPRAILDVCKVGAQEMVVLEVFRQQLHLLEILFFIRYFDSLELYFVQNVVVEAGLVLVDFNQIL